MKPRLCLTVGFLMMGYAGVHAQDLEYVGSALWKELRDVKVVGSYAYCTAANGLIIFEAPDSAAPAPTGQYYTTAGARGLDVADTHAYVCTDSAGLMVFEIGDANAPVLLGSCEVEGAALAVAVADTLAYMVGPSPGVVVVDVSNPAHPEMIGQCTGLGSSSDLCVAGSLLCAVDPMLGLRIVDIADPRAPSLRGTCGITGRPRGVVVIDTCAYLAADSGLYVVNIRNSMNPTLITHLATPHPAMGICAAERSVLVCTGRDLMIYDVSNPLSPQLTGSCAYSGDSWEVRSRVSLRGEYVCVTASNAGLYVIRVSDAQHPILTSCYDTHGSVRDVTLSDSLACTVDGYHLYVLDMSHPESPEVLGRCNILGGTEFVVQGDYAYVSGTYDRLQIFDISDPRHPVIVSTCPDGGYALSVTDSALFLIGNYNMAIIDISDPYHPVSAGEYYAQYDAL
jgi:hypothetical protein